MLARVHTAVAFTELSESWREMAAPKLLKVAVAKFPFKKISLLLWMGVYWFGLASTSFTDLQEKLPLYSSLKLLQTRNLKTGSVKQI
jgi:hypothetical protein